MAKMTLREYANAWLKNKGTSAKEAKKDAGKYKSIAAAKKAGSLYYTDKNGNVMLAVYAEDLKGPKPGGRDSSPRPKLRPGSKKPGPEQGPAAGTGATLEEAETLKAATKRNQEAREEKAGTKERTSAGQKFNAWYKKNGKKYGTMKEAMEAYQATLKMSKGGMAKKRGYSSGGSVAKPRTGHTDRRSKGLFN